jgi:peptidoglycan/LPS O-acetylase OafA/YrhL
MSTKKDYSTSIIEKSDLRFYSLDVLRGIAALGVVFWHWQHFFYIGAESSEYLVRAQPFYSLFFVFYHRGYLAVDLFFMISGFIFFWLYSKKIADKKIGSAKFFIFRFARLYPLHFLTLLLALFGQLVASYFTGEFVVYPHNDIYHFILNIFLVPGWGFQNGFSYNAPVWSVSVEVFLYIVFFFYSYLWGKIKFNLMYVNIFIVILVMLASTYINSGLYRGLVAFFIGGTVFIIYTKFQTVNQKLLTYILALLSALCWTASILSFKYDFRELIPQFYSMQYISGFIFRNFNILVLFPITILFLISFEKYSSALWAKFKGIGDISYSVYLLHFPLQVVLIFVTRKFSVSSDFYYLWITQVLFFIVIIGTSYLSFNYIEKPAQNYLRNRFKV